MQKLDVKGVIFDLWGTLVYNIPQATSLGSLSDRLNLTPETLWGAWRKYAEPALRGDIKSGEERARLVLADLGLPLDGAPWMAQYERENRSSDVHFYPGVPEMLAELRQRGYKTCLVSNTNYLSRAVVDRLQIPDKLDEVILSCEVGMIKPEVAIYQLAAKGLGLETTECLFVGDGGDNELDGALAAGCKAAVVQQERGFAYRNPGHVPTNIQMELPNVIDVLSYL